MEGALSYQDIQKLLETGALQNFPADALQPASVDLSISSEIYRVRGGVLPQHGEKIRDLLKTVIRFPHDLSQPLEPGESYLCRIAQTVNLPGELYGYTNPKSSTGRNDIQVRLLADGVPRFDTVRRGFNGKMWVLISSKHFLLKLTEGDRLLQLRLFQTDTRLGQDELRAVDKEHQLLWTPQGEPISLEDRKLSDHDGSLILTIDLDTEEVIGYRAKLANMAPILIFNEKNHKAEDFFEPIARSKDQALMLEEGRFYIFYTHEWVRVPPMFAAEMVAMDERSGEFRSHYAGFIDPGWGYGRAGEEKGWPLVMEMRPFDDNLIIRHKQPVCKLKYERIKALPEHIYGETGSHYRRQKGAMLSKHFVRV